MDIYSPAVLNRVVQDLKGNVSTFLLDMFFPEVSVSTQEEIFFDVLSNKPRLAPFVSPLVEGQIVQSRGYTTKSFSPAYIKDKRPLEDGKAVRRLAGQPIAGPIDPMTNRLLTIAGESEDQIAMLYRRLEWMAAEELRTGKVTVSGEKYPTVVVDFGRDAALSVVLLTTARWNDSAPTPIDDLEEWGTLVGEKSGASAVDVVMASNVWKVFRANAQVKDQVDAQKNLDARTLMNLGPDGTYGGAQFKGVIGSFNIWVYPETYVDDAGVTRKFVPDDYLLMGSRRGLEGVRHFGGIKDEKYGFQATDFFSKSWTQDDPAIRYLMLQSAPLVVPYRVNATLSARVIGGS